MKNVRLLESVWAQNEIIQPEMTFFFNSLSKKFENCSFWVNTCCCCCYFPEFPVNQKIHFVALLVPRPAQHFISQSETWGLSHISCSTVIATKLKHGYLPLFHCRLSYTGLSSIYCRMRVVPWALTTEQLMHSTTWPLFTT